MRNLGFIGFDKYAITEDGKLYSLYSRRFLKVQTDKDGYLFYTLYNEGEQKGFRAHRLVGMTYLDLPAGYENLDINHKNGCKADNHYKNLEWATKTENNIHAIQTGLRTNNGGKDFLELQDVHRVCAYLEQGIRPKEVAAIIGTTYKIVSSISIGEKWKHISCEYNFSKVPRIQRLNISKVISICEMLQEGISVKMIASKMNTSATSVYKIKNHKSNCDISNGFTW
ncbi:helix-turn-helix domain-containing protein [Candidatus Pacearchaeota archaeon]|nr:helix-turn-helix domain-containing protein [Candidatus Pacearchaeota archaeon]